MSARNRAEVVDANLVEWLRGEGAREPDPAETFTHVSAAAVARGGEAVRPGSRLTRATAVRLFEAMVGSRHLDLLARRLRAKGEAFYTIGGSGHESNAVLGELLRTDDPAFLHYRSGAFVLARGAKDPHAFDAWRHIVYGLVASREEAIAGGRHKVFGSRAAWIVPLTSTIGSHAPRAVGMAFALERAKRIGLDLPLSRDAVVVCGFGDASLNHSTTQGALNAACWAAYQRHPIPVLFVCEDNGTGISVPSPRGWVATVARGRVPQLHYVRADGTDLAACYDATAEAVDHCRKRRGPVFLHLEVTRLLGHAGSDVETTYRTIADIERAEAKDPVLAAARFLVEQAILDPSTVLRVYEAARRRADALAAEAIATPKLTSADEVVEPLAPIDRAAVASEATRPAPADARARLFGGDAKLPERSSKPRHLAFLLNRALLDLMAKYPGLLVFGEDVGKKGGVYHVTAELQLLAGRARCFDTLLDEQTILGLALGAGLLGMLPSPEIQYLAYVHNALDQIRGEACSMAFFSRGQFTNPMVVRIAGLAYQKGFGGHFHNDNSVGALLDIPGIIVAAPARPDDAVRMLRSCFALAQACGSVVVFLEPIALYMQKDLHAHGDGGWLARYPEPGEHADLGRAEVIHASDDGDRITIVTYANGLYLSLRAARILRDEGVACRLVDLRWLAPLDHETVAEQVAATGRLLMVDECRRTGGGVADQVIAEATRRLGADGFALGRVDAVDTYIPLGDAANLVLPQVDDIVAAGRRLAEASAPARRSVEA